MILTVTLNPCVDQTMFLTGFKLHDRNKVDRLEVDAGGKGINLSRIVAEMGGQTTATGFLGGENGAFIRSVLDREGVIKSFVEIQGKTRSNLSIESGDGAPTVISVSGPQISDEEWNQFLSTFQHQCETAKWVCLGGSIPAGVPKNAYSILGKIAKELGKKVLLDADGDLLLDGLTIGPDLIKPNANEAARLLGWPINTEKDSIRASQELYNLLLKNGSASPVAIVSRGQDGATMTCTAGTFTAPAVKVSVNSTIGSGDSMLGAMVHRNTLGDTWDECLRWGIAAGAATAESDGTSIGKIQEIERLYQLAQVSRPETS